MKSYLLQLGGREEGPYTDTQVAQMFADGRVDQRTPCKTDRMSEWRTIDEFLPTLKYGSERPVSTRATRVTTIPPLPAGTVKITDVNVPFGSVLIMAFKIAAAWLIVAICVIPLIVILWFVALASIVSFFAHLSH